MKLTKTIKDKFLSDILSKEVASPDFAGETSQCWKDFITPLMPLAVAEIYQHSATEAWVSPSKILELRNQCAAMLKNNEPMSNKMQAVVKRLDAITVRRDHHDHTVNNIRIAVTTAMDSVTTVAGLRKQLPAFAKYLPAEKIRPNEDQVQAALFAVTAAIAKANAPAKKRASRKAAKAKAEPVAASDRQKAAKEYLIRVGASPRGA